MIMELINKTELLEIIKKDTDLNLDTFKKMSIKDLRNRLKITHISNGEYKNMSGYCFKCLTPLKPDYIKFENYCLDC